MVHTQQLEGRVDSFDEGWFYTKQLTYVACAVVRAQGHEAVLNQWRRLFLVADARHRGKMAIDHPEFGAQAYALVERALNVGSQVMQITLRPDRSVRATATGELIAPSTAEWRHYIGSIAADCTPAIGEPTHWNPAVDYIDWCVKTANRTVAEELRPGFGSIVLSNFTSPVDRQYSLDPPIIP